MPTDTQKTIAGALLFGASALTGNALLLTAAGGVGVNWASEGLIGLWAQRSAAGAGTPVTRAAERAIRRAVDELRRTYSKEVDARSDGKAFALVRECAAAVAEAQPSTGEPLAAQQALLPALDALLHGHDARQVEFIKGRLLEAVAVAFRNDLASDEEAWRLFHGWLIEQLNAQMAALSTHLSRLPEVLAQLDDLPRATAALDDAAAQLDALLVELRAALARLQTEGSSKGGVQFENQSLDVGGNLEQAGGDVYQGVTPSATSAPASGPARDVTFQNTGVKVKGDNTQAGGNIYKQSAHVQGSGSGVVVNNPPPAWATAPPAAPPAPAPPAEQTSEATPLRLVLTFDPSPRHTVVRWEADVVGVAESRLSAPYTGDDLALVVRALEAQQTKRVLFTGNEQTRLAELGLLHGTTPPADLARRVGRALYDALTADASAARALATARDHATATGRALALALRFPPDAVELAALPWELLWADEPTPLLFSRGMLADCTRHLDLAQALAPTRARSGPLHILAISPQAGIPSSVRDAERAARMNALKPLLDADQATLREVSLATREAIVDAVHEQPPDIIHYYGHGHYANGVGQLYLDDGVGGSKPTTVERLLTLFGRARLVVLHACQGAMVGTDDDVGLLTGIAPALSAAGVPVVIAMQLSLRVTAATRANAVLYRALAAGRSVQAAVNEVRQALEFEEDDQASWYVPTLYIRTRETGPVYL